MRKLLLLFLPLFVAACQSDGYETGDSDYSFLRSDFAELYTSAGGQAFSFTTDDGDSLLLKEPQSYKWASTADSTYRVLVYYSRQDGRAEVFSAAQIPVPVIHPHDAIKDVATDPVKVQSVWVGANGRYLNLSLGLMTGTQDEKTDRHTLGMLCDTLMTAPNGHRHLHLRLYHAQNNVPEYYTSRTFISVPLRQGDYPMAMGDTVSIVINTYEGEAERRFIL